MAGGARGAAAGGGGRERSGKRRGGLAGRRGRGRLGGGGDQSRRPVAAATDLCPHADAPSVPPALRGSARPPADIGPPGLGAGAPAAREAEAAPLPRVPAGGRAGEGPRRAASEPAGRPAGREEGQERAAAHGERAQRAEGE